MEVVVKCKACDCPPSIEISCVDGCPYVEIECLSCGVMVRNKVGSSPGAADVWKYVQGGVLEEDSEVGLAPTLEELGLVSTRFSEVPIGEHPQSGNLQGRYGGYVDDSGSVVFPETIPDQPLAAGGEVLDCLVVCPLCQEETNSVFDHECPGDCGKEVER